MSSSTSEPDPLDALAETFLEQHRQGLSPCVSEYARRHPDLADRIRELFPALLALEGLHPEEAPAPPPAERKAPERLGDYRLLRELGRGGMGVVYEAVHEALGRHVALKVLPFNELADPVHLERFKREARAAARLHHTNIVPVFDVGEHDGIHYYAMQFIRGQALDAVLHEVQRLRGCPAPGDPTPPPQGDLTLAGHPPAGQTADTAGGATPPAADSGLSRQPHGRYYRSVARLGVQAAQALEYAHRHGILHRDIKPANLLLDAEGAVWVMDFGLAKSADGDGLTGTGEVAGTLRYLAPERFRGQTDARSDVYSLGVTLYEMLTLRPAFDAADRAGLIANILHHEPAPPRRLDRRIPRDLETVVLKAMAREPELRYASADELAKDLQRFLDDQPVQARRVRPWQRVAKWVKRRPLVAGLLALLAVSLGVLLAVLEIDNRRLNAALARVKQEQQETAKASARAAVNAQEAEKNFDKALAAVNRFLTRVGDEKLKNVPQLEKVWREVHEDALTFYHDLLANRAADPRALERVAEEYFHVAEAALKLGDLRHAEATLRQSAGLFARLSAQHADNLALRRQHGIVLDLLGQALVALGESAKAVEVYRQAVALIRESAAAFSHEALFRTARAAGLQHLADALLALQRLPEAKQACDLARALLEPLAGRQPPDPEVQQALASALLVLGTIHLRAGRLPETVQSYRRAVEILERFADAPRATPSMRALLTRACQRLSIAHARSGQYPQALRLSEQAREHKAKLANDYPSMPHHQADLALIHTQVATLLVEMGRGPESDQEQRQAIALSEELLKRYPDRPNYRELLVGTWVGLGARLQGRGALPEAEEALRKARGVFEGLPTGQPERFETRLARWRACTQLGLVLMARKRLADAKPIYREALALEKDLLREGTARPADRLVVIGLSCKLGEVAVAVGDWGEARRLAEQTLRLYSAQPADDPPIDSAQLVQSAYSTLTQALVRQGAHAEAARRARELTENARDSFREHVRAGACLTACVFLAEKDQKLSAEKRRALAESYADQAVEFLRTGIRLKGADTHELRRNILRGIQQHPNAAALRAYPRYQKLLKELEEAAPR